MSLYAIGDLHLHFQTNRVPHGQLKDRLWKGRRVLEIYSVPALPADKHFRGRKRFHSLMAEEYGAEQGVYAHCHEERMFHDSILGEKSAVL